MDTQMLPSKVLTKAHGIILNRWSQGGDSYCGGKRCALGAVAEVLGLKHWTDTADTDAANYLDFVAASLSDDGDGDMDIVYVNDRGSTRLQDMSDLFLDAIDDAKADEAEDRKLAKVASL